jgi:hypothetical protein
MNEEYIIMKVEKLIAMFVIAVGTPIGKGFTYFPKLPKPFSENIDFQNSCGCNADLLCLRVNSLFDVEVWFADEDGDTFYYGLKEIQRSHPILFVSLFTHIFDMIESIKED